jgi:ubiquinone/menaquinone biosynthesis C-methylase UbiE
MSANLITDALPAFNLGRLTSCLPGQQSYTSDWTLEQLNILPYQHLLEIGYGQGRTTQAVARKLKTGFIAGIDCSVAMYQRAWKRNRRAIEQQLLQLHVGNLYELPYPSHYFHTIYGTNAHLSWKDPQMEFIRLAGLLRSGGRLVMILQPQRPRQEKLIRENVERIEEDYLAAGLTDIRIRYKDTDPVTSVAVTGYKA